MTITTELIPSLTERKKKVSWSQPKLFSMESPLQERLGPVFFQNLPELPGVYFFYGETGDLLYIGQSSNLRARVGSYRYVSQGKHPKRTLRLVSQVHQIVWQGCDSANEAIATERELLLLHRPPFNRAGVWQGEPWWLTVTASRDSVTVELARQPSETEPENWQGPFHPSLRHALGSLLRCLYRISQPSLPLAEYPCGLCRSPLPQPFSLAVSNPAALLAQFQEALIGETLWLADLPDGANPDEQEYWNNEVKSIVHFTNKSRTEVPETD